MERVETVFGGVCLGTVCLILGAYGFAALSPLPYTVTPSTVGFFVLLAAVWVAWLAYTIVTAVDTAGGTWCKRPWHSPFLPH